MFDGIAETVLHDGDTVVLGRVDGQPAGVMEGPSRLETVIQFDDVEIDANSITFIREHFTGHRTYRMETGSIEAEPAIVELLAELEVVA